jgi:hypothetical protein
MCFSESRNSHQSQDTFVACSAVTKTTTAAIALSLRMREGERGDRGRCLLQMGETLATDAHQLGVVQLRDGGAVAGVSMTEDLATVTTMMLYARPDSGKMM